MKPKELARQLEGIAELEEPTRRKLYFHVVDQPGDVSRDDAARATGISRSLAAFHLDRLVEAGLLETTFRRLSSKTGPGAGRPSKLYRRGPARIDISLPERRYELAAQVIAQALAGVQGEEATKLLADAARAWGTRLARDYGGSGKGSPLIRAMQALRACGFEPLQEPDGRVVLRNCPFDALRAQNRQMICGMNVALVEGLLAGLGLDEVHAMFAPREGMCCVALLRRSLGGDRARPVTAT